MPDAMPSAPTFKTRRVVTGRDARGRSTILIDEDTPFSAALYGPDFVINDVWAEPSLPAPTGAPVESLSAAMELDPPRLGNMIRILQIPPDAEYLPLIEAAPTDALGESGRKAATATEASPHPLMHSTNSVDYVVILWGEVYAVLEAGETLLKAGDVLVQRGTNHAWSNRSSAPVVMACTMNGAVV